MPSDPTERGWRRRVACEDVVELLPGIVDSAHSADKRTLRHIESCLRCQAELARYRKLLRGLRQLRSDFLDPGPGVLAGILGGLEEAGEPASARTLVTGRRAAYLGGMAVATAAAGAAGAIVLASRASRRRMGLAG
jgi:hypothetical protein